MGGKTLPPICACASASTEPRKAAIPCFAGLPGSTPARSVGRADAEHLASTEGNKAFSFMGNFSFRNKSFKAYSGIIQALSLYFPHSSGRGGYMVQYRHEWKHELSFQDYLILRQRLRAVME
ncbi:MAG: hypothetical protein K5746_10885, partial [Clostridiales bacterium]|nr:hypothetical protein [Clostridiales bacterium]